MYHISNALTGTELMYGPHRELPLGERQPDRSIRITHGAPSLKFFRRRRELPLQSVPLFKGGI